MSAPDVRSPRPLPRRLRAAVISLSLSLSLALSATAPAQDGAPAARPAALDPIVQAQAALREGSAPNGQLSVHAARLLEAGDVTTLGVLLRTGPEPSVRAILEALVVQPDDRLADALLVAVGRDLPAPTLALGTEVLGALVAARPDVPGRLVARLEDPALSLPERRAVLATVGRGRDLAIVDRLILALGEAAPGEARAALRELTGHDLGNDPLAWRAFWNEHFHLEREVLLDLGIARLRARLERLETEVVNARIARMDDDVEAMVAALGDEYAAVRRQAAERLAGKPDLLGVGAAVPVLLRRLGHEAPNGHGEPTEVARELDPLVRAAFVSALGVLGRDRDGVVEALVAELSSPALPVARAAASALAPVRGHPETVVPLLDYIDRVGHDDADVLVEALATIAQNGPRDVTGRLLALLERSTVPRVRAKVLRALLASAEPAAVLGGLAGIQIQGEAATVRYDVAVGLTEWMTRQSGVEPADERVMGWLELLLEDQDDSVRAQAALALGASRVGAALPLLEAHVEREANVDVVARIVEAIGRLGEPDGAIVIGRIVARLGEGNEALRDKGRRAIEAIGADGDAALWMDMADQLRQVNAYALAAWTYDEAAIRGEGTGAALVAEARGRRAEVLFWGGQYEAARALLQVLEAEQAPYPTQDERLRLLARACEQVGDASAAAEGWLAVLARTPQGDARRAGVLKDAARTLDQVGRHGEALPLLVELIALDENDLDVRHRLALTQVAAGRPEEALATYDELIGRVPAEDERRGLYEQERRALVEGARAPEHAPAPERDAEPPRATGGDGEAAAGAGVGGGAARAEPRA